LHQQAAVRDVVETFERSDRSQLVMACGTGKTLTTLWVAEALWAERTLVLERPWRTRSCVFRTPDRPSSAGRSGYVGLLQLAISRTFTAAYKLRIVAEANAATEPGAIGALLRREGLYSSHLVEWRRLYRAGAHSGLARPRGVAAPGRTV
jgi:transposase-like protein